ncbi:MFS transporter [Nonomuraea basaltis]|uniref:MFS transporter n=1 Tax=Nonomuraea basaltis TaxID=2495887 RepID=UPI0023F32A9B|nr:MFS transporter [Nonomuraea basaltis]
MSQDSRSQAPVRLEFIGPGTRRQDGSSALACRLDGTHDARSALAPNYPLLITARVLVGVAIGGFWAIAGGLAVRLVPAPLVPRATAIIFGGVGAANVFGVPIGTVIGGLASWRIAFGALSALALVVLVALLAVLPPLTAAQPVGLRRLADQFRNQGVRVGILATFLIVTGHFAAYTFISPVLRDLSGIDEQLVGPLLFGFGMAGVAGNFIAGAAVAKRLHRTVLTIAAALGVTVLLYPIAGLSPSVGHLEGGEQQPTGQWR